MFLFEAVAQRERMSILFFDLIKYSIRTAVSGVRSYLFSKKAKRVTTKYCRRAETCSPTS